MISENAPTGGRTEEHMRDKSQNVFMMPVIGYQPAYLLGKVDTVQARKWKALVNAVPYVRLGTHTARRRCPAIGDHGHL